VTLIILSGTIEHRVKQEAEWLGLAKYFDRHIYGSTLHREGFSKRMVIDRILREEKIEGRHLVSFGDGPVEIAETKAVGGLAIAVASDEEVNGSGIADPLKSRILSDAGADAVIPDYRNPELLMRAIFGPS
jgi:phosphoglycolate phosphatase